MGTPVPNREIERVSWEPSDCKTSKLTFAEGLDVGMSPQKALKNCPPARMKDITFDRLKKCVEAGLTIQEIAVGFGTTVNSVRWAANKAGFKFSEYAKKGENKEDEQMKEQVTTVNLEPEWDLVIGESEPEQPEMRIRRNGTINIRLLKLQHDARYAIRFTRDMKRCQLFISPTGRKPRVKSCISFELCLNKSQTEKILTRIALPVSYRLNPDTMIGEIVKETGQEAVDSERTAEA